MIQHVYEKASSCPELDRILIATDSKEIQKAALGWNMQTCMTSPEHGSGTERVIEVQKKMPEFDHYVNIQGDEPLIHPDTIAGIVQILGENKDCDVASSAVSFQHYNDFIKTNFVKVVLDHQNKALYFSRSVIPYQTRETFSPEFSWKHQGIYGYTSKVLKKISGLPETWLEHIEELEQLRMVFFGLNIYIHKTEHDSIGVDHPDDIPLVEKIIKKTKA